LYKKLYKNKKELSSTRVSSYRKDDRVMRATCMVRQKSNPLSFFFANFKQPLRSFSWNFAIIFSDHTDIQV